jgi:hypothetical protein
MLIIKNKWFKPGDKLFIPGDIHAPNHNPVALALALRAAQGFGCNKSALIGDFFDSCHISRHGYSRDSSFAEEDDFMWAYTEQNEKMGMQPTFALDGNHEGWWEEYSESHPGLQREDMYPSLYANWDVLSQGSAVALNGNLLAAHGDALNGSCAASPAASVLRNYPGLNIIFGHNHRLDMAQVTRITHNGPRTSIAASIGTMADLEYEQSKKALRVNSQRHALGFCTVSFFENDLFDIQLGRITPTKRGLVCMLAGKLYK